MDPFPVELWTQIFVKLNKPEWVALSGTCRRLQTIARPELYENVHLYPGDSEGRHLTMTLLARSFADRPSLTGLVKHLSLGSLRTYSDIPVQCRLHVFSNLQTLRLIAFHINAEICSAIHSLQRLTEVNFIECAIDSTLVESHIPGPERKLHVRLFRPWSTEGWRAISPGGLKSLLLEEHAYRTDPPITEPILTSVMLHGPNRDLTSLFFGEELPLNIVPFLISSPQLRRLTLFGIEAALHSCHPLHLLPNDAIPLLEFFSGPAEYSNILTSGRPVRTVEWNILEDMSQDVLLSLRSTSAPVTKLVLRGNVPHIYYMLYAPVTLKRLQWRAVVHKGDVGSWTTILCGMVNLDVLDIVLHVSDRKEIVQAFSDACPSLREMFIRKYRGCERWCRRRDDDWECYQVYY